MRILCVLLLAATSVRAQDCAWSPSMRPDPAGTWRELSAQAESGVGRRRTVRVPRPVQGPANFIDVATFARMTAAGIRWAPRSTDAEFLRRVSLDLTGRIPTAARAREFFAGSDPRKREKLVDELIASDGFVDRWSLWLGDLVQNVEYANMSYVGPRGRNEFYAWMRESLARNDGYDVIARQVLASGVVTPDARPSMYLARRRVIGPAQDTWDNLAAASGEHFLGLPMNCLSCHDGRGHLELVNSALATRTRLDFWKMAAFFSRTRIAGGTTVGVFDEPQGNYALGTTSGNKSPRSHPTLEGVDPEFLTGETPVEGERWRDAYARFVVADPRFATVAVNRIWKEMFGLALVEPANNVDFGREILQRELLDELAGFFRESNFDLRALLRTIALSETYQFARAYPFGTWSESWTPYFARHFPRRMLAESLLDAILRSTHTVASLSVSESPPASSAMRLPDTLQGAPFRAFLDDFGRGNRDEEQRSDDVSIPQALRLLNEREIVSRAGATDALAPKLVRDGKTPSEIVEELFITTLTRFPTAEERSVLEAELARGPLAEQAVDLHLALLQSVEFLFY